MPNELSRGSSLLIDTAPLIYFLEGHALALKFAPLFQAIERGEFSARVTPITLAEVLVAPIRAGSLALAHRYQRALTRAPHWSLCELSVEVCALAATARTRLNLKLPDAFQYAAAQHHGCAALVTHDRDFSCVSDLQVYAGEVP